MTRLDEIKEGLEDLDVDFIESAESNIRWLIKEVERLREELEDCKDYNVSGCDIIR